MLHSNFDVAEGGGWRKEVVSATKDAALAPVT